MYNFNETTKEALIDLLVKEMSALEECEDESLKDLFNAYEDALSELTK